MNNRELVVPENVNYLSDWHDFDSYLPKGKVILNKSICGCGCTEAYLTNDMPVILVSPRRELINCKMNKPNRARPLHYFDRSKNKSVESSISQLWNYISCPTPGFVPKVIVTYDSLKIVLDTLTQKGLLAPFSIIVDEFPCIFTDAKLKGLVELTMIRRINSTPNHVVFVSATPIKDIYLDETMEFCNIPIVTLKWPRHRYETINLVRQTMRSTREACGRVINDYFANGFFKSTIVDGVAKYSKEALFFLNSVSDILSIIKKFKLTPDEALVICADDDKNRLKLKELGFEIGHANNEQDMDKNKTFTFITKASFEGTDFYSTNSSTYIFADPAKDSLSLDISIDLPQIAGRCRTETNPFRNEISYFYKTSEISDIDAFEKKVNERIEATDDFLRKYGNIQDFALLNKLRSAQESERYKTDYIDVTESLDETGEVVINIEGNIYAKLADLRGIEILRSQYNSNFSVFVSLQKSGFSTSNPYNGCHGNTINAFCSNFFSDNNFTRKMKLYVEFLENNPTMKADIEAIPQIPMEYKSYYNTLAPDRIRALGYRENAIVSEIKEKQAFQDIQNALRNVLVSDNRYTSYELKSIIQKVYDDLDIIRTAKGTDIEKYIPTAQSVSVTDSNGKRKKGYKI